MADSITNNKIDNIMELAINSGAYSGKVSGVGGGGFIIFVVDPTKKYEVIEKLNKTEGMVVNFNFSEGGCHGWKLIF